MRACACLGLCSVCARACMLYLDMLQLCTFLFFVIFCVIWFAAYVSILDADVRYEIW